MNAISNMSAVLAMIAVLVSHSASANDEAKPANPTVAAKSLPGTVQLSGDLTFTLVVQRALPVGPDYRGAISFVDRDHTVVAEGSLDSHAAKRGYRAPSRPVVGTSEDRRLGRRELRTGGSRLGSRGNEGGFRGRHAGDDRQSDARPRSQES